MISLYAEGAVLNRETFLKVQCVACLTLDDVTVAPAMLLWFLWPAFFNTGSTKYHLILL